VPFAVIGVVVAALIALHFRRRARERAEGSSYAAAETEVDQTS
jgi:hypothetical protein